MARANEIVYDLFCQVVFFQYNNLKNPCLFGQGHETMTKLLRDNSVSVDEKDELCPTVDQIVQYPDESEHYIFKTDLEGDATANIKQKCDKLDAELGVFLDPNCTHLLFWDKPGDAHGGRQECPWSDIEKLKSFLCQVKGVQDSVLLVNGTHNDLNVATRAVQQSNPVVALKCSGGAAERLAEIFEANEKKPDAKDELKMQAGQGTSTTSTTKQSPGDRPERIDEQFAKYFFVPPADVEER